MEAMVLEVFKKLKEHKETFGVSESCTGGLLCAAVTEVAGSSEFFMGAAIAYSNASKTALLDVPEVDIKTHGAVSQVVAEKMAQGVRHRLNCTYALAITGIAGPGGGTADKPVGTICFAVVGPNFVFSETQHFQGQRSDVRNQSVQHALKMLLQRLK